MPELDSAAIIEANLGLCGVLAVALALLRNHRFLARAMGVAGFLATASLAGLVGVAAARLVGTWGLVVGPPLAVLPSALLVFNVVMRTRALGTRWFLVGLGCCGVSALCLGGLWLLTAAAVA